MGFKEGFFWGGATVFQFLLRAVFVCNAHIIATFLFEFDPQAARPAPLILFYSIPVLFRNASHALQSSAPMGQKLYAQSGRTSFPK